MATSFIDEVTKLWRVRKTVFQMLGALDFCLKQWRF